jgi:hypothetical protein
MRRGPPLEMIQSEMPNRARAIVNQHAGTSTDQRD